MKHWRCFINANKVQLTRLEPRSGSINGRILKSGFAITSMIQSDQSFVK
jgi:hypothetical protein